MQAPMVHTQTVDRMCVREVEVSNSEKDVRICGVQGNVYRPNVVRIGSEEAPVSARAKDVWVDGLIARYMDMDTTTWAHRSHPYRLAYFSFPS